MHDYQVSCYMPTHLSSLTEINLFSFSEDLPFCARLVQVFLVLAQKAKSKENKFIFSPSLIDFRSLLFSGPFGQLNRFQVSNDMVNFFIKDRFIGNSF
jgi:hypothetical protein